MGNKSIDIAIEDIFSIGVACIYLKKAIFFAQSLELSNLNSWYDQYQRIYNKYADKAAQLGANLKDVKSEPYKKFFNAFIYKDKIIAAAFSVNFLSYAQEMFDKLDSVDKSGSNVSVIDDFIGQNRKICDAADYLVEFSRKYPNETDDKIIAAISLAKDIKSSLNDIRDIIEKRAEELRVLCEQISRLVQPVEGHKLDEQQINSIICDADNQLVLAGAGTGKTTTIIGKVKYLLKTDKCTSDDLLLLSFTNKSAEEMKQRVYSETGFKPDVMTFHKLGLNIISEAEGKMPVIYSKSVQEFVRHNINKYTNDAAFRTNLLVYCFFAPSAYRSPFDFESAVEYTEYIETNPPVTIKKETVKGYCEMEIANFLYRNRINYTYEKEYEYDVSNENYTGYHPDFYLDDYGVYIEFYAVNKDGHVPAYFSAHHGGTGESEYLDKIQWKRKIHKEHNTTLIEVSYADKQDNKLCEKLQKKLEEIGVKFDPMSDDELWEETARDNKNVLNSVCDVIGTVITLMKSNGYSFDKLRSMTLLHNYPLINLAKPIYNDYENMLKESGQIDFTDMIVRATEYIKTGKAAHKYSYVIVDEYQDISKARFMLLSEMRCRRFFKLFCVGDDWQSIYRFAGSDIGYILNFEQYWGKAAVSKIETTYRFPQKLIEISGRFIMTNPNQVRKLLQTNSVDTTFPLGMIQAYNDKYLVEFMANKMLQLERNSTVFLIGRYTFDKDMLKDSVFSLKYDNFSGKYVVYYSKRPDLKIEFLTAHKSKGLQADHVFILNNKRKGLGFPSRIQDDPLIQLLLDGSDRFPFAEERRLFYVAMTRAKKKLWLLVPQGNESDFAKELISLYSDEINRAEWTCPKCGGRLVRRSGKNGEFWGCSNFSKFGCKYTRNISRHKE